MNNYRARQRAAGLKQVTLWLPDTKSQAFLKEARRQSLVLAAHDPAGEAMLKWIDETYEWLPE